MTKSVRFIEISTTRMGEIVVTTDARPETEVEGIKRTSDSLRGDIALELDNALPRVSNESEQLLKFRTTVTSAASGPSPRSPSTTSS
jgi:hypothetical protein